MCDYSLDDPRPEAVVQVRFCFLFCQVPSNPSSTALGSMINMNGEDRRCSYVSVLPFVQFVIHGLSVASADL